MARKRTNPTPSSGEANASLDVATRRNRRLLPLYAITGLLIAVLLGQLGREQFVNRPEYLEREKQQTLRRIILPAPRGTIYDRDGRLLAGNRATFSASVFLDELRPAFREEYIQQVRAVRERERASGEPAEISNRELVWRARMAVIRKHLDTLGDLLGRDLEMSLPTLRGHFHQRILLPLPLVENLTEEEYAILIDQLPPDSPIVVATDSARYYPYGPLAAHTLGYVVNQPEEVPEDREGDDLLTFSRYGKQGKAGVEREFDGDLHGNSGEEVWRVDPQGFQFERVDFRQPAVGNDVYLSLDVEVQQAAERALDGYVGAAVALDPRTGEVLALASRPTYDLNELTPRIPSPVFARINEEGAWLNRAVQGLYPPGSTFKPVTAMAALREDQVEPEETLWCGSSYLVGNRRFPEHSTPGFGDIALERALAVSSNVYFYQTGLRAGPEAIADTSRILGLATPTGVELPFETDDMLVPDPAWKRENRSEGWWPGDTANFSIGQGFLRVTPLQMAVVAASFATGETGIRPTLLRREGEGWLDRATRLPLPLAEEDRQAIVAGMRAAVAEGTARRAQLPGIEMAGKTGTAQVYPGGKARTLAWFIGFAPLENPRIAFAVVTESQEDGVEFAGGVQAAPIARAMLEAFFAQEEAVPETEGVPFPPLVQRLEDREVVVQ
jgi:penicillin-binding protein 2